MLTLQIQTSNFTYAGKFKQKVAHVRMSQETQKYIPSTKF